MPPRRNCCESARWNHRFHRAFPNTSATERRLWKCGNLADDARFSHSHSHDLFLLFQPKNEEHMASVEKWKSKDRIPTFPHLQNRLRRKVEQLNKPHEKETFQPSSPPTSSGSFCIGIKFRFQDHSSIGKCSITSWFSRLPSRHRTTTCPNRRSRWCWLGSAAVVRN